MRNFRRAYAFERDESRMPFRMIWLGDFKRVPVDYVTCPKCPDSPRLVQGRCLVCWGDWSRETKEVRA